MKGRNCLGRQCDSDVDCRRSEEQCCFNKCTERNTAGHCVDFIVMVCIVACTVVLIVASGGFIFGAICYVRRRGGNRNRMSGQVKVLASTQQAYEKLINEESFETELLS